MIKKIKKLLGICEHKWIFGSCGTIRNGDERGRYDALQFQVKIICENCGKNEAFESDFFDKSSISTNHHSLEGAEYWTNADDCKAALLNTVIAEIVWKSFAIKCKNKYGINLKK